MITRFALFEGHVNDGLVEDFRHAVLTELLPKWKAFPGATHVRVNFLEVADKGAPAYPLILSISYPTKDVLDEALAHPIRLESKAATDGVLSRFFSGVVHHHVTTSHEVQLG